MKALTRKQKATIKEALGILEKRVIYDRKTFDSAKISKEYFKLRLMELEREEFHVAYLGNDHRLIKTVIESTGTINAASVYPREIVKAALKHNASAVIFAHNHPSGCAEPSTPDRALTDKLVSALSLVDIKVLDHLVVGDKEVVAFSERGFL